MSHARLALWMTALCIVLLLLAACGRRADDGGVSPAPERTSRVIPTMPPASFAQPTTMIGGSSEDGTGDGEDAADPAEASASAGTPEPEGEAESADDAAADDGEEADASEPTGEDAAEEDAPDLARGESIYGARGCAECHGEQGQGVPDAGSALAGLTLTESEFSTLLRTGGGLGPDHLYGPSAVSPSGVDALYAWLQALEAE